MRFLSLPRSMICPICLILRTVRATCTCNNNISSETHRVWRFKRNRTKDNLRIAWERAEGWSNRSLPENPNRCAIFGLWVHCTLNFNQFFSFLFFSFSGERQRAFVLQDSNSFCTSRPRQNKPNEWTLVMRKLKVYM